MENLRRLLPHTPNCEYSPHKRTRIALSVDLGRTRRQIAFKEGVNRASILTISKRYRYQTSARSKPRSGRPRKIDEYYHRRLLRCIAIDPFISSARLGLVLGLECHPRTISRHLKKHGIEHNRALGRPKLSEEAAAKRLEFARLHVRKPPSWWRRWIFSDESTVARSEGEKEKWVFVRKVRDTPTEIAQY